LRRDGVTDAEVYLHGLAHVAHARQLWNQHDRLVFTMQGTTLFDVTK
jgi:hypothetical protein